MCQNQAERHEYAGEYFAVKGESKNEYEQSNQQNEHIRALC
jgi:hypothetical protein